MSNFSIKPELIIAQIEQQNNQIASISKIIENVNHIQGNLAFNIGDKNNIRQKLKAISSQMNTEKNSVKSMKEGLWQVVTIYKDTEKRLVNQEKQSPDIGNTDTANSSTVDWGGLKDKALEVVELFGPAGNVVNTVASFWNEKTPKDKAEIVHNAVGAVGSVIEKALDEPKWVDWFGFDMDDFKNPLKDFYWENGAKVSDKVGVVTKWAGVLTSGVVNFFSNQEEMKTDGISQTRAIEETIMETVVDVGKDMLISAAIGAAATAVGITSAPAVVVGGAALVVGWGLDCACEHFTGKSLTEATSDFILDTGEAAIDAVADIGKTVNNAIGEVGKRVGGALSSGWKSICGLAFA